jgi:hypothetical protein
VTFGTTESIAVPTGAICAVIGATLLATGINSGVTCAMETIGLPATSAATSVETIVICEATAATCVPTVATFGTIAEIFEGASGKEFDRSYFEERANGGSNHCRRLCVLASLSVHASGFLRGLCVLCG